MPQGMAPCIVNHSIAEGRYLDAWMSWTRIEALS